MRLIDADALKDTLGISDKDIEFAEMLDEQPTVDAEPVKHGKWIDEGYYADYSNYKAWHCSKCNWHMLAYDDELFSYCPMCGAKMDGEDEQPSSDVCDQISELVMERIKAEKILEQLGQNLGDVFGKIDEVIDDYCNEILKEKGKEE